MDQYEYLSMDFIDRLYYDAQQACNQEQSLHAMMIHHRKRIRDVSVYRITNQPFFNGLVEKQK